MAQDELKGVGMGAETVERKKSNLARSERRRRHRRDWLSELARIQERQAQRTDSDDRRQRHRRAEDLLLEIHAMLLSQEFREFYLRQTGVDPMRFLSRVVISPDEFMQMGIRESQLEWTKKQVQIIMTIRSG